MLAADEQPVPERVAGGVLGVLVGASVSGRSHVDGDGRAGAAGEPLVDLEGRAHVATTISGTLGACGTHRDRGAVEWLAAADLSRNAVHQVMVRLSGQGVER